MNEFYCLQVSSEINNSLGIFHTKDNESVESSGFQLSIFIPLWGARDQHRLQLERSWIRAPGLLSVWGTDLSNDIWCDAQALTVEAAWCSPDQLDSSARRCLLSLPHLCQILLNLQVSSVKCLNLLFQREPSFLFPLALHPSFGTAVPCPPFPMPSFFFPHLLHGHDDLYVFVFVITTSALGKLGEMNSLCDKLNINSSKKPFWSICLCLYIHLLDESLEL